MADINKTLRELEQARKDNDFEKYKQAAKMLPSNLGDASIDAMWKRKDQENKILTNEVFSANRQPPKEEPSKVSLNPFPGNPRNPDKPKGALDVDFNIPISPDKFLPKGKKEAPEMGLSSVKVSSTNTDTAPSNMAPPIPDQPKRQPIGSPSVRRMSSIFKEQLNKPLDINAGSSDTTAIPAYEKTNFNEALQQYDAAVKVAMDEYKTEKNNIRKAQLWDGIIKGIATMSAGIYGLTTGNYSSDIKFDPTDWSALAQANMNELNAKLGEEKAKVNIKEKQASENARKFGADTQRYQLQMAKNQQLIDNAMNTKRFQMESAQTLAALERGDNQANLAERQFQFEQQKFDALLDKNADDKKIELQKLALGFAKINKERASKDKPLISMSEMNSIYTQITNATKKEATAEQREALVERLSALTGVDPNMLEKEGMIYGFNDLDDEEKLATLGKILTQQQVQEATGVPSDMKLPAGMRIKPGAVGTPPPPSASGDKTIHVRDIKTKKDVWISQVQLNRLESSNIPFEIIERK